MWYSLQGTLVGHGCACPPRGLPASSHWDVNWPVPNSKDPFLCELYSVSVDYSSNCMTHIMMRYLTAIFHLDHVATVCRRQNTIKIITLYYNAWQTKVILNSPIMVPGSAGSHSLLSFSFFLFFVYSRQDVHVSRSNIMDHSLHITAFHLRCDNCTAAG